MFPNMPVLPCRSFDDAFAAVRDGRAALAMIPVDNTLAGRVADVHHLLPQGGLYIVGECFERVRHNLMALPGVTIAQIKVVETHIHAIGQCRRFLKDHRLEARVAADTAGAAADLVKSGARDKAAIASRLAAEIYGLDILAADIEDEAHNTTRFLILAAEPDAPEDDGTPVLTTFTFTVRNVPAALYKALGGFATNGVNMVKLESYIDGTFTQASFLADIMGHPAQTSVQRAFEELSFFARDVTVLGTYRASPSRARIS
ncbi:prephenate dehydratase [Arboricoccus pini]|uniref:prephenate dehydratase n=2 Tax=Arboricoccus pini TaxID=1963835 RepID=A0A212R4S1_9PROT|nr:prephenate dehydratase [Arboricoccus pini]